MDKKIKKIMESDDDNVKRLKNIPGFEKPMLATLTKDYFDDPDWIYERKLDGERVMVYKDGKKIDIMTRNEKRINFRYPEIEGSIKKNDTNFIIDGEVVAFSGNVTSFSRLQKRMHLSSKEEAEKSDVKIYYYLFDIIYFDGFDISGMKLRDRKKILRKAIDFEDPLRYVRHRNEKGKSYYESACEKGWEGLIAKDATSPYVHTRSKKWLKFKCVNQQEFVITGYTDPKGSRVGLGALLLGYYEDDKLRYAGQVGTGFDDEALKDLRQRLQDIRISEKPHPQSEKTEKKGVNWVKPKMVAEIGFTEWTDSGKLRHPRFLGLRRDKNAKDVKRERPR